MSEDTFFKYRIKSLLASGYLVLFGSSFLGESAGHGFGVCGAGFVIFGQTHIGVAKFIVDGGKLIFTFGFCQRFFGVFGGFVRNPPGGWR